VLYQLLRGHPCEVAGIRPEHDRDRTQVLLDRGALGSVYVVAAPDDAGALVAASPLARLGRKDAVLGHVAGGGAGLGSRRAAYGAVQDLKRLSH
jgi:hypothetical protein